jgi:hypothetical protein
VPKNLLIITSALFAESTNELCDIVSFNKRKDLLESTIVFYKTFFSDIIIWDQTIPPDLPFHNLPGSIYFNRITYNNSISSISNIPNPSSYLEANLLTEGVTEHRSYLQNFDRICKISSGYIIKNIDIILSNANTSIVYRFGNPFRIYEKYCLTSFYIFSTNNFINFVDFIFNKKIINNCTKPIEFNLWEFIKNKNKKRISIIYPDIKAYFWSVGKSSNNIFFQLKLLIYKILSTNGLFAYSLN